MATSLLSIPLPPNTWVDLYDATGITIGTQIIIQNIGSSEVKVTESLNEPLDPEGFNLIVARGFVTNADSNIGAWAIAELGSTLQVEVAL